MVGYVELDCISYLVLAVLDCQSHVSLDLLALGSRAIELVGKNHSLLGASCLFTLLTDATGGLSTVHGVDVAGLTLHL